MQWNHSTVVYLKPIDNCDSTAIRLRYDDTTTHSTTKSNRTHIVISITSVVVKCILVSSYRSRVVVESQLWYIGLRYDYDPTMTYRARMLQFDAIRREQKINMSIFRRSRVVVVSQSNRTQIVISSTFVVVECVVASSYRSRIAIVITA